MPRNRRRCLQGVVAGTVLLCAASITLAADSGLYVGLKTAGRILDTSYSKYVANGSANTDVDPALQGRTFTSSDSANGLSGGVGIVSGYRVPFGTNGMFSITGEFDAMLNFGSVDGKLPGASDPNVASDGLNRLGENWPDDWSFKNRGHYGLTVKLGLHPVYLRGTSIYGLAGVRLVNTLWKVDYSGCLTRANNALYMDRDRNPANDTCPANLSNSGTLRFTDHLTAWTVGAGLEKMIWQDVGLQFEARYVGYEKSKNETFSGAEGVSVGHSLTNSDVELSLNLVWFFL